MQHTIPSAATLLAAALEACHRGWSVIPMAVTFDVDGRPGDKKPARRWKQFQTQRAGEKTIRRWFSDPAVNGIGVVFGPISKGLASRDFDVLNEYERWAEAYPDFARRLPTIQTRRGRQVFCIAAPGSVETIRAALGKPDLTGAIHFRDGELRAGIGCYSLLPPSIHPSGHLYRWLIPPTDQIPVVDLAAAGFVGELPEERAHATERTESTEAMNDGDGDGDQHLTFTPLLRSALSTPFSPSTLSAPSTLFHRDAPKKNGGVEAFSEAVEAAIKRSLPSRTGQRNRCVFHLARELKAIPSLADAPANAPDLEKIVRKWHKLALPTIATKPWDDSWSDFLKAWPSIRHPAGQEPIRLAFERAKAAVLPEAALKFERPEVQLLIALCCELQRTARDRPFYLACRTAGELLQLPHTRAWRWLDALCNCGILRVDEAGTFATRRATRYRYLPPQ
jgi:hypothetical protein